MARKSIKADQIGAVYRVKHNGMKFTVTISNDPSQYQFYSDLGLDVFEFIPTADVETKKVVDDSTGKSSGKSKRNGTVNG